MSLGRTMWRKKHLKDRITFCVICERILCDDEDLDLHFKIIHPGVDKEGPYEKAERDCIDQSTRGDT